MRGTREGANMGARRLFSGVLVALVACGESATDLADPATADIVGYDSAGVHIVDLGTNTPRASYSLSPEPTLQIGTVSGDPDSELFRVSDALTLSDGRIVVANNGTQELKVFNSDGGHLRTVGGSGDGPGEYRSIDWLSRMNGDSVLAFDWGRRRLQVYDQSLELMRTTTVNPLGDDEGIGVTMVAAYLDGRLLGVGSDLMQEYPVPARLDHIYLFSPMGVFTDSIGPFPSARRIWMSPPPPIIRAAVFIPWEGMLITATSDLDEFYLTDLDGKVEEIVRGGVHSRPPNDADIQYATRGTRYPPDLGEPWIPELLPYWSEFRIDPLGAVWRRAYTGEFDETVTWTVVEEGGARIVELTLPIEKKVLELGVDHILLLETDELGIERVARYTLTR